MMINWAILTLGQGSLNTGFPHVTLEIRKAEGNTVKIPGGLPDAPKILELYRRWKLLYGGSYERLGWSFRMEIDEADITNFSEKEFEETGFKLKNEINIWLNCQLFEPIEKTLRTQLNYDDKIGVIIETNQEQIQRLPWELWEIFEDYPHAIHAFSPSSYYPRKRKRNKIPRTKVKVLGILGQSQGLDLTKDILSLQQISDAIPEFLTQPKSEDLNDELWKLGWDILFFAGHSKTEKQGIICLNDQEVLTVKQIKYAVNKAITRGLQLAIFNSCDGLGLARDLTDLQLPVVIVMREPVPDEVAQVFLRHFLAAYAQGKSVLMAVLEARQRLEKLESKYPYATGLPTIFLNPSVPVPTWQDLGRIVEPDFSPYQGLFTFQIKDAPFFFGRENFTNQLVEAVQRQPLVVITGASGSGKSSVVFAGLIPQLHRLGKWHDISFRPGDRPLMALAGTLIQILEPELSQSERIPKIRTLAQHLWKFPDGLRDILDEIFKKYPGQTILLIIDQFEELYSLCQNRKEQNVFVDRLLKIVNLKINLRIVITIRADFLEQAYSHRKFTDALQYLGTHILGPMNAEEKQRAIVLPARTMGVEIEKGLTQQIIKDSAGNLPLLEFALTQLWEKQKDSILTHAVYEEIGGAEQALTRYAEIIYNQLNEEEKERVQRIFLFLVGLAEGTKPTRRLATRSEIGEENWDLVSHLGTTRLVNCDRHPQNGEATAEIVHEALIEGWERLRHWLEDNRRFLNWRQRTESALKQWKATNQDEGALLRGAPLTEAETWLQERPLEVLGDLRLFIELSLELRIKEQQERQRAIQRTIMGITGFSIVAVILAGIAGVGWYQAQTRQTNAEIRALASKSKELFTSNQEEESLKEAIRAGIQLKQAKVEIIPDTKIETLTALRQVIDSIGFIEVAQLQHNHEVLSVRFNPIDPSGTELRDRGMGLPGARTDDSYGTPIYDINDSINDSINDQLTLATASGNTVQYWKAKGEFIQTFEGHSNLVTSVVFSPDGRSIASASKDKTVKLWDLETKLVKSLKGHNEAIYRVAFDPQGELLASVSLDGVLNLWQKDGKLLKGINTQINNKLISVDFNSDGKRIVSGGRIGSLDPLKPIDGIVQLWSRNGELIKTWNWGSWDVAFSPNENIIALASGNEVQILNLDDNSQTRLLGHQGKVTSVAFSPNGQTIASASEDKTVKLWRRDNGKLIKTLRGHQGKVYSVAFSPDGQTIASGSEDKTVRIWKQNTFNPFVKVLKGYGNSPTVNNANTQSNSQVSKFFHGGAWSMNSVSFSPSNKLLAATSGNLALLWYYEGTKYKVFNNDSSNTIWNTAFSPDGKMIALAVSDSIQLWNVETGSLLTTFPQSSHFVNFSPDGKIIASAMGSSINLWSIYGNLLYTLKGHQYDVTSISFSPDQKIIASSSLDKTIKLWTINGKLIDTLTGHINGVNSVAFNPKEKILASASSDQTIKIWDYQGKLKNTFRGHTASVNSVQFSSDGQLLISGSNDNTVKIWNLNGTSLDTLKGHSSTVWDVSFSPDGKSIASASDDNTVILWSLEIDQILEEACNQLHENQAISNDSANSSYQNLCLLAN